MNSRPLFSIIVPTYNRASLISKTIHSLLNQSYPSFEIIIIDDGSTDNTESVVYSIPDSRIKYKKVKNGERGRARNIGTLQAHGDYITFIDSDDLAYSNHLEEALKIIKKYNFPEIFHLAYEMKDTSDKIIFQGNKRFGSLNKSLLKGNSLSCIGVFLKKEIAQSYLFEEDRKLAGSEDWHLWLRLASRFKIYYSNTITSCMINHENRSVLHFDNKQMLDRTILLKNYLSQDDAFIKAFGNKALYKIEAHMYTYIALHSILAKDNVNGIHYFVKGVEMDPLQFFRRRTLAIFKYFILNAFQ